jgi:hypothetical protein
MKAAPVVEVLRVNFRERSKRAAGEPAVDAADATD